MNVTIEGQWRQISRRVRELTDQGWRVVSCEPNATFTSTTCVVSNGIDESEHRNVKQCQHLAQVRIGKSNMVKCLNPKCRKVKYVEFER